MTEITKKSGASKAVATTLAGVLAVGMVPAAAFAAEADQPVAEDSLELLADGVTAFNASTVKLSDGKEYKDDGAASLTAKSEAQILTVTSIQPAAGSAVPDDAYTVTYFKATDYTALASLDTAVTNAKSAYDTAAADAAANPTDTTKAAAADAALAAYNTALENQKNGYAKGVDAATAAQTFGAKDAYKIVINGAKGATADYKDGKILINVTYKTATLTGITAYEGDDVEDTEFTYDGTAKKLGFKQDGKKITTTAVKWAPAGTAVSASSSWKDYDSDGGPTDAGNYVAIVTTAAGEGECAFTVNKLDLSKATITAPAGTTTTYSASDTLTTGMLSINGVKVPAAGGSGSETMGNYLAAKPTFSSTSSFGKAGSYTYTLKGDPDDATNKNITGVGTFTLDVVADATNVAFYYGDTDEATNKVNANDTIDIKLNKGESFKASEIGVVVGTGATAEALKADQFEISYAKGGVPCTEADLAKNGTYDVTVTIKASETDYEFGGSVAFKVKVSKGEFNTADVYLLNNGAVAGASGELTLPYDGKNKLEAIDVAVKVGKETLVKDTDYTVEYTAKGEAITEAVNAGEYTITVKGAAYSNQDGESSFTLTIAPIAIEEIRVASTIDEDGKTLAYTGSEITPAFEYVTNLDAVAAGTDKKKKYAALPAEAYTVVIKDKDKTKTVSVKDAATYYAVFADKNANDNYALAAGIVGTANALEIVVSDTKTFQDVATSDWFYQAVKDANTQKYMFGIGDTNFFAPYENLTRAQAAQVIYNMAGGDNSKWVDEGQTQEDATYSLPFADTDGGAWYAKAVYWANGAGIVTGYDKGGKKVFDPEGSVTREQFALMLQRYAKLKGDDTSSEASIAAYADAAAVDSWATAGVTWAVDKKIMGVDTNYLNPTGKIARAEAAAMVTRYQPKKLTA